MSAALKTFRELIAAEWLKVRTTRTSIGLAVAVLLVTVGPALLVLMLVNVHELGGKDDFTVLALMGAMVGLLALVWGILGMAGEFRYGTITYTILATPRRWRVILIKLAFYFVFGALLAVAALLVIQVLSAVVPVLRGGSALLAGTHNAGFLARIVLTTGLFAAFGVALGALLRSQVVTIVVALVWILAEQMIIVNILKATGHPRVAAWLPLQVFSEMAGTPFNADTGTGGTYTLSPTIAAVVGIGYIAVAAVAATLTTMRRDVT